MLNNDDKKSADDFWREYEEKTGEKVLKRGLGKYVSGWDEFDKREWGGIWGLVMTTSAGFRFHHFPQYSWLDSLTRFAERDKPREKTFFLPNEKIISNEVIRETKWWKKIFSSSVPHLIIKYLDEEGSERRLLFDADYSVYNT